MLSGICLRNRPSTRRNRSCTKRNKPARIKKCKMQLQEQILSGLQAIVKEAKAEWERVSLQSREDSTTMAIKSMNLKMVQLKRGSLEHYEELDIAPKVASDGSAPHMDIERSVLSSESEDTTISKWW